jgi:RNA-binding protein
MPLSKMQKKTLSGRAHHLKPVLMIGNKGITDNVLAELELTLKTHELIKIKLPGGNHDQKAEIVKTLCDKSHAEHIQTIGHVATLYRENPQDESAD